MSLKATENRNRQQFSHVFALQCFCRLQWKRLWIKAHAGPGEQLTTMAPPLMPWLPAQGVPRLKQCQPRVVPALTLRATALPDVRRAMTFDVTVTADSEHLQGLWGPGREHLPPHNRRRSQVTVVDCRGGGSIWAHRRQQNNCKDCTHWHRRAELAAADPQP